VEVQTLESELKRLKEAEEEAERWKARATRAERVVGLVKKRIAKGMGLGNRNP
jgi:hypothetical protein